MTRFAELIIESLPVPLTIVTFVAEEVLRTVSLPVPASIETLAPLLLIESLPPRARIVAPAKLLLILSAPSVPTMSKGLEAISVPAIFTVDKDAAPLSVTEPSPTVTMTSEPLICVE